MQNALANKKEALAVIKLFHFGSECCCSAQCLSDWTAINVCVTMSKWRHGTCNDVWKPSLYYVSTSFRLFLTHPPYVSLHSTVRHKNCHFYDPTHPILCWSSIGMVPNDVWRLARPSWSSEQIETMLFWARTRTDSNDGGWHRKTFAIYFLWPYYSFDLVVQMKK